jgi:uncharacterized protein (TIGR02266 family)
MSRRTATVTAPPRDRRREPRIRVLVDVAVDPHLDGTYLFARGTSINVTGVFVRTDAPLPPGTELRLRVADHGGVQLELEGVVAWWNPPSPIAIDPGMGVRFVGVGPAERRRLTDLVGRIAYLG